MSLAKMSLAANALGKNTGTGSENILPAGMVGQCAHSANKPNNIRRICYWMMKW